MDREDLIHRVLSYSFVTLIAPSNRGIKKHVSGEKQKDIRFEVKIGEFYHLDNLSGFNTFSVKNDISESIKKRIKEMGSEEAANMWISVKDNYMQIDETLKKFLAKYIRRTRDQYYIFDDYIDFGYFWEFHGGDRIPWIEELIIILFDLYPDTYPIPGI